mmetsp:Transcript_28918/g.58198  ORF Transcript_28918/g.58198 Transcript_28918/m.58198 type:complete len:141 (-) Transcript_28918:205-627(-)
MGQEASSLTCGTEEWMCSRSVEKHAESNPSLETVEGWIKAREDGDVEMAAKYCHPDFVFSSPQLSLSGLKAAKERLFGHEAPTPESVLMPLQRTANGVVFREISFKIAAERLYIRQEWTLVRDKATGKLLIGTVSASRVA